MWSHGCEQTILQWVGLSYPESRRGEVNVLRDGSQNTVAEAREIQPLSHPLGKVTDYSYEFHGTWKDRGVSTVFVECHGTAQNKSIQTPAVQGVALSAECSECVSEV